MGLSLDAIASMLAMAPGVYKLFIECHTNLQPKTKQGYGCRALLKCTIQTPVLMMCAGTSTIPLRTGFLGQFLYDLVRFLYDVLGVLYDLVSVLYDLVGVLYEQLQNAFSRTVRTLWQVNSRTYSKTRTGCNQLVNEWERDRELVDCISLSRLIISLHTLFGTGQLSYPRQQIYIYNLKREREIIRKRQRV